MLSTTAVRKTAVALTDPEDLRGAQAELRREEKVEEKSPSLLHSAPGEELTAGGDTMTERSSLYPSAGTPDAPCRGATQVLFPARSFALSIAQRRSQKETEHMGPTFLHEDQSQSHLLNKTAKNKQTSKQNKKAKERTRPLLRTKSVRLQGCRSWRE